jgi:hypothetical protein
VAITFEFLKFPRHWIGLQKIENERKGRYPMIEQRFRFTLTKRQVDDLEDNLLLDSDIVTTGIEQPDGTFQFALGQEDLETLTESLAAACNHADDEQIEARLDTIYKKLVKVLER